MHTIVVEKVNMVLGGEIYRVSVGCKVFHVADKDFVARWVGAYITDPYETEKDWYEQPWNQDEKARVAETAQYTATQAAQRNLVEAAAAPRGLGATLGRR